MFNHFNLNRPVNVILLLVVLIAVSACHSPANKKPGAAAANDTGWISLFNGKTTSGWHTYGKHSAGKAWKAEDSVLHLDAALKKDWQTQDGGDLVTNEEFENFALKFDWKIEEAGNSGLMFYVHEDTSKYKYSWESGPELQIADNEKNEDGKIYKSRAADLYELVAANAEKYIKPAGSWNSVEITMDKGKLDEYVNGKQVLSVMLWNNNWNKLIDSTKFKTMPGFGTYKKGSLAFQDHGADVWFRNIQIKKL